MKDVQQFLKQFQQEMNWEISTTNYETTRASMLNNYMLLTTEVAEIAEEFRSIFNTTHKMVEQQGMEQAHAFELAKTMHKDEIGKEIADCIAYLVKFANYLDIDMEQSFYDKMDEIKHRNNKDQRTPIAVKE